jgi:pyrroline-5-carboxylate reductase
VSDVILSPRSAETAARLAALSPRVRVAHDNHHVVDASDTVFLAIRPDVNGRLDALTRALDSVLRRVRSQ